MTVISGQERDRERQTDRYIDKIGYERPINNDSYIRARERQTELVLNAQSIMTVISGRERDRQTDRDRERQRQNETETDRQRQRERD